MVERKTLNGKGQKEAVKKTKVNMHEEVEETEKKAFDPEAMNEAAEEAEEAFRDLDKKFQKQAAAFWAEWFVKAGHKRLGRMLVKINKELNPVKKD
jgi:hypothetical protein